MSPDPQPGFVHYLPIVTTVLSAIFLTVLIRAHLVRKSGPHLLWWAAGVFCYGLGTAIESSITLFGNTAELTKAWYIAGALLGGYPLAQGSVYLLHGKRFANRASVITIGFVALAAVLVILSPVNLAALEPHRPSGSILEWRWVRLMTPFINLYAFVFLVGGALVSAVRYFKGRRHERVWGNVLIAFGGLLPGIGGSMAKAGLVEALYVLELVGLVFIWAGYTVIAAHKHGPALLAAPENAESIPAARASVL